MTAPAEAMRTSALAWLIWALGAAHYFYAFFQRVTPSVIDQELMRAFAASGSELGSLGGAYFFTYAALQFPLGILLDRYGPRRIMAISALIAGIGSIGFGLADSLTPAIAGRLLVGAGVAVGLIGTMKLIMVWLPPARFATFTGITMFIGVLGALLGQAPVRLVVDLLGWRETVVWAGVFGVLLAAAIWLVVRDRRHGAVPVREETVRELGRGLGAILANPQTWYLSLFSAMLSAPILTFTTLWGATFARESYGMAPETAVFSMSVALAGFGLGLPSGGWASDRLGRRKPPLWAGAVLCLATWLIILYWPQPPLVAAFVLFFVNGLASGWVVTVFALAREVNPPRFGGSVVGFINMVGIGGVAVLQPLTGLVLDELWDGTVVDGVRIYSDRTLREAFLMFPACSALALACCFFTRESYNKQVNT